MNSTPTPTLRAAAGALVTQINAYSNRADACRITVTQICEHFEQKELRSGDSFRSFAAVKTYRGYIRKWVKPRWGSLHLDEIKAVDVEGWLRLLPIARSSRTEIRNIMFVSFNHACRHELFDSNSRRFVRQGAKRRRTTEVLNAAGETGQPQDVTGSQGRGRSAKSVASHICPEIVLCPSMRMRSSAPDPKTLEACLDD